MIEKTETPVDLMFDILNPYLQELEKVLGNAVEAALIPIVALRKSVRQGCSKGAIRIYVEVESFHSVIRITLEMDMDFLKLRQIDWLNNPWDGKPPSESPHKGDHYIRAGQLVVGCYKTSTVVNYAAGNQPAKDALVFANQLSQLGQITVSLGSLAEVGLRGKVREIGQELLEKLEKNAASKAQS